VPEPEKWAALVPELSVTDLQTSLDFYTRLLGFEIVFDRPETRFAYLQLGEAQLMLDQIAQGVGWQTGAVLERPFGRGINLQIEVADVEPMLARLAEADYPLFVQPEENWYRTGEVLSGVREFLVQDPDGYVLRFSQHLGEKPA
jgi:catechol 2,3-dioxygenase-like lactoylglutathione lyase family enzyme